MIKMYLFELFPKFEKILINMISESVYPGIKFEKKVDLQNFLMRNLIKKIFFKIIF